MMHNLGSIQNAINPWAVFNPWETQESRPTIESSDKNSRFGVYDDAAMAAINPWAVFNPWAAGETTASENSNERARFHVYEDVAEAINPWAVFNPWDTQESQSTSEGSDESSRFHVSDDDDAAMNPWSVFNPWDTQENQTAMEIHQITQTQIKADAYEALRCQANVGPRRVLNLLRNNIARQDNA